MATLKVEVKDGYVYNTINGKTVSAKVSPALHRYTKVHSFNNKTGDIVYEAEFIFPDGEKATEFDSTNLITDLSFGFIKPKEVVNGIDKIVFEY